MTTRFCWMVCEHSFESNKMFDVKNMASTGTDALGFLKNRLRHLGYRLWNARPYGTWVGENRTHAAARNKIIVLSMHDDPAVVREMLREGANAYILKKIRTIVERCVAKKLLKANVSFGWSERNSDSCWQWRREGTLTSRENEVLRLVAKSSTAGKLLKFFSSVKRTVETHRKTFFAKQARQI